MAGKKYNNWLSVNPRFIIALKNRNYRFSHNLLDPLMYPAPFQKVGFMLQRSLISYFLSILVNNNKHIFNTNYHESMNFFSLEFSLNLRLVLFIINDKKLLIR